MGNADPEGREDERPSFELEEESERSPPPMPPSRQRPTPPSAQHSAKPSAPQESAVDRRLAKEESSDGAFLDERRRRRLLVYGPVMLLLYLLVGWFFAGQGLGWFALAGIGVGIFAAWRRRDEVLLGSVAAVAGVAASLLAVGGLLLFVIVATGMIGYIAGIDDRLRNG